MIIFYIMRILYCSLTTDMLSLILQKAENCVGVMPVSYKNCWKFLLKKSKTFKTQQAFLGADNVALKRRNCKHGYPNKNL